MIPDIYYQIVCYFKPSAEEHCRRERAVTVACPVPERVVGQVCLHSINTEQRLLHEINTYIEICFINGFEIQFVSRTGIFSPIISQVIIPVRVRRSDARTHQVTNQSKTLAIGSALCVVWCVCMCAKYIKYKSKFNIRAVFAVNCFKGFFCYAPLNSQTIKWIFLVLFRGKNYCSE